MDLKRQSGAVLLFFCAAAVLVLSMERSGDRAGAVLFWEAESTETGAGAPDRRADPAASGSAFVRLVDGRLTYALWIATPGEYALWGRVNWRNGCNDIVMVTVNTEEPFLFGNDANYEIWHWTRGTTHHLHGGYNSVEIESVSYRPVDLDCFLLTTDMSAEIDDGCVGIASRASVAFNDDFYGGLNRNWRVVKGDWRIEEPVNLQFVEQEDAGRAIVIRGDEDWIDYSFRAAVRFREEGSIGLVFSYVNEDCYCAARIDRLDSSCVLRLAAVREGFEEVLGERAVHCEPGRWYLLRAEVARDGIRALVDEKEVVAVENHDVSSGPIGLYTEGMRGGCFDDVEVASIAGPPRPSRVGYGTEPVVVSDHGFEDGGELDCWHVACGSWLIDGGALRVSTDTAAIYNDRVVRGSFLIKTTWHLPSGSSCSLLLRNAREDGDLCRRFAVERTGSVHRICAHLGDGSVRRAVAWFGEEETTLALERHDRWFMLSINGEELVSVEDTAAAGPMLPGVAAHGGRIAIESFTIEEVPYYQYRPWDAPVGWTAGTGEINIGHIFFYATDSDRDAVMWCGNDFDGEDVDIGAELLIIDGVGRYNDVELVFTADTCALDRGYGLKVELEGGIDADGFATVQATLKRGGDGVARHVGRVYCRTQEPCGFSIGLRKRGAVIGAFIDGRPVAEYADPTPGECRKLGFVFSPFETGVRNPPMLVVADTRVFQ
jgi:hypothetical protein